MSRRLESSGALRELAAAAIRRAGPHAAREASRRGEELVAGRWALVDQFLDGGRRHLVARRRERARGRALTRMETACVVAVLDGRAQKVVAIELGIRESTLSTHVRSAMRKLGIGTRAELARVFGARRSAP